MKGLSPWYECSINTIEPTSVGSSYLLATKQMCNRIAYCNTIGLGLGWYDDTSTIVLVLDRCSIRLWSSSSVCCSCHDVLLNCVTVGHDEASVWVQVFNDTHRPKHTGGVHRVRTSTGEGTTSVSKNKIFQKGFNLYLDTQNKKFGKNLKTIKTLGGT